MNHLQILTAEFQSVPFFQKTETGFAKRSSNDAEGEAETAETAEAPAEAEEAAE